MESALYIVPVLIIVVVFLSTAIKVLREFERAVIFRLGRQIAAKGPGLVLLIPLVDKMVKVSLRTLAMRSPSSFASCSPVREDLRTPAADRWDSWRHRRLPKPRA